MLTFKEYLQAAIYEATSRTKDEERIYAKGHPLFTKFSLGGWTMTPMAHAAAQAKDRWKVPDSDWVEFLTRIVKKLNTFTRPWKGDSEIEFKSEELKLRVIMNVNVDHKNLRPITVLSKDMGTKTGTKNIRTESEEVSEVIDVD